MQNVVPVHIVQKVMWLMLGFAGVIVAAIVITNIVDAHDDVSGATGVELDTKTVLKQFWAKTPNPCAEISSMRRSGSESGDLRELGMFASVSGLPPIRTSRFQSCSSNGVTGEVALSFVINDSLTLIISNSKYERAHLINQLYLNSHLDRTAQATELQNNASPSSGMRSSVYQNDPNDASAITGSSSASINDLLRNERNEKR